MPFWAATLVDRIIVLLVPIIAVLLPMMKIAPWLYSWRIRSRIYRWYGELKFLELELQERFDPQLAAQYLERLDDLEKRAHLKPTPGAFAADVYTLRQHIDMVRSLLKSMTLAATPS